MATILDLPIELLTIIATDNFETFKAAIRAPGIGPMLCCEYSQNIAKSKFIEIIVVDNINKTYHCVNGIIHNIYGPAVVRENAKEWHINGELHRIDGPAVKYDDGDEYWYVRGKLHRENDKPSIILSDGSKFWHRYGKLHRDVGPAIIREDGGKEWFIDGARHRIDGPALIYGDGTEYWYVNGTRVYPIKKFN
jgi:hypothetical protein